MAAPLATEKVLRGILQSFVRGGIVASDSDVAILEAIPNNATDADISDILDTVTYGSGATGGTATNLLSDTDVEVFVDVDDNNASGNSPNHFRISQNQADIPVTLQANELATIADRVLNIYDKYPTLIIGARTALCTSNQGAVLSLGSSTSDYYGQLVAVPGEVSAGQDGLSIRSSEYLDFRCDNYIMVGDVGANYIRGGWDSPASYARLHVGDFTTSPPDSLAIEAEDTGAGFPDFTIRPTYSGTGMRRIFIRGSNVASSYRSSTVIGGKGSEAWSDAPATGAPSLHVIGDDDSTTASALYVYDRKTGRTAWSSSVTIETKTATPANFYYFRILDSAGAGVFNINSNGDANLASGGSYLNAGADVAELVTGDASYEPGTVLALQQGLFTRTQDYGQPNVAGVVATQPGVVLGHHPGFDTGSAFPLQVTSEAGVVRQLIVAGDVADRLGTHLMVPGPEFVEVEAAHQQGGVCCIDLCADVLLHEDTLVHGGVVRTPNLNRLAICGIVPVLCSTECGDILGNGETLVSGPDGTAVVDPDPKPGTIIGKAKGRLVQDGDTVVKGLVEALVNLQ